MTRTLTRELVLTVTLVVEVSPLDDLTGSAARTLATDWLEDVVAAAERPPGLALVDGPTVGALPRRGRRR